MKFSQSSSTEESVLREMTKILKTQAIEWFRVLRNDVVISTTSEEFFLYHKGSSVFFKRPRTWKEYRRLIMVHWFLDEEVFALIHLELEELVDKYGIDKSIIAQIMLKSKPEMLDYILHSSKEFKNERALFGSINAPFKFSKYHFQRLDRRKPKRKIRRRGYNDQGSRRLPHEVHEAKEDWSFTERQNQIEEDRKTRKDLADLMEGFLS